VGKGGIVKDQGACRRSLNDIRFFGIELALPIRKSLMRRGIKKEKTRNTSFYGNNKNSSPVRFLRALSLAIQVYSPSGEKLIGVMDQSPSDRPESLFFIPIITAGGWARG